ncbi:MAG TPA: hypothetical protein VGS05_03925 [Candidatus Sulfotelmatobacter sp.]|nr:hypothetical protein [Candidatus Sulfotelmatobacter sp.]
MAEENKSGMNGVPELPGVEEPLGEEPKPADRPGMREILRQAFDKARCKQRVVSKSDKGRDRSRSLFLLAGGAIAVMLLFLVVFSSPNATRKAASMRRTTPDLGRRVTPGQQASGQTGSVTPLLNAQTEQSASLGAQDVTPEDVNQTARPMQPLSIPNPPASSPEGNEGQYALGRINFSSPPRRHETLENNGASARSVLDDLKKPSLVFVRSAQSDMASSHPRVASSTVEESPAMLALPAGTRLVARLQSVVTSAVKTPVVAAIEYNYERDGAIVVPAGATAIGSVSEADRSGYVSIHFDSLELPDGTSEKIDGAAMSLDYGPLRGHVSGKKTGTNFLVRAFTGLGEAATYLVGSVGLSAPLSESALLRDRMATNIGMAGDQELNSLGFNQNIVVTVPANTRFYIVMEKGEQENGAEARQTAAGQSGNPPLPSIDDLRQLMQLRRELSEMYQQSSTAESAPQQ